VSQEQQVVDLFNTMDEKVGPITGLVNNAGILLSRMRLKQMHSEVLTMY
tara:strand:+ start:42 stop:188 length:147 start_codon:yes stop_codon:yes gene_type:complete